MHGSTFQASRTDRERRRAAGPTLTVVAGSCDDAPATSRVAPRAHPGFEGFTPDGITGTGARATVHRSEPESSTVRRLSRGSDSPDTDGSAHSGSGPHVPQADVVRRIAEYLADHDERAERAAGGDAVLRSRP